MNRTMTGVHRLALVSITLALTSLGWVPAFADEGPLATAPTTTVDQSSDTAVSAVDGVDAATGTVEAATNAATTVGSVPDAATTTVGSVTNAATTTVGSASNSGSGAAGTITSAASDAEGLVAASAGNLTDAVTNGTAVGDDESDTESLTTGSSDRAGTSSHAGTSSGSTQAASPIQPSREFLTLAVSAEDPRWTGLDTAPCPDAGGPRCSPTSGTSEENSLAEKISEVIGLLAVTGFLLLPWIAAALALAALGSVALGVPEAEVRQRGA